MPAVPLPPRPDPRTGLPRPPDAPVEGESNKGAAPERGKHKATYLPPPDGMGPTLEGYRVPWTEGLSAGLWLAGLVMAFLCLLAWASSGNPLNWAGVWYIWVIVGLSFAVQAVFLPGKTTACGSDWLMRNGKRWVKTYELCKVKLSKYAGGYHLELMDNDGRELSINLRRIQDLPYIWDYTYLGILHSVVYGNVETNRLAVKKLRLPLQQ